MAQKLDANLNVISETPIDIQMIGGDLNIISALDDEPNDVGGLTSAELKAKFDEAGLIIQKYINEQLIPAIIASDATETARASAEAERALNEVERVNSENTRESNESTRKSAETSRVSNEKQRVANERKREDAETGYVAQAKKYAEAAEESAQNAIASGVFMGGKYTTLEEYYTAYYTEKRPCFMRRSFGLDEETPATTFWVMDDVLTGDDVTEESKHAKFYRIHEDGTVLYGKLTADGTFTVTEGKTDTFVGDNNTTAREFYEAYAAGKVCFMMRTSAGSGVTPWVMSSVNAVPNAGAGYVYTAYFYRITPDGKILWGVLSHYGDFTETDAGKTFVGDYDTTVEEYKAARDAGKACFLVRARGGGANEVWAMSVVNNVTNTAHFYHIVDGIVEYATLDAEQNFEYQSLGATFVGDYTTKASDFLKMFQEGKACFLKFYRGGGYDQWTMFNATQKTVESAEAYFYHITDNGVIEYATLDDNGNFTRNTAKDKADASTTTTAGTYGSYNSSGDYYYIPCITVNEQGIVTDVSQAYLGLASSKNAGIMSYNMYSYLLAAGHIGYASLNTSTLGTATISLRSCQTTAGGYAIPVIYGVYYKDPETGEYKPYTDYSCASGVVTVNVTSDHISSTGTALFIVVYEKTFTSYSGM